MTRSLTAPLAVLSLTLLASFGSLATAAVLHDDSDGSPRAAAPHARAAGADHTNAASSADLTDTDFALASAPRLSPAATCDDLLAVFHEEGRKLVGPWGWQWGHPGYQGFSGARADLQTTFARDAVAKTREQSSNPSGTNVQESGVDEPDVAKTTGSLLVRIDRRTLTTYDVSGDQVRRLGSLRLPDRGGQPELLLEGDRALAVESRWQRHRTLTRVSVIDLSDPAAPALADVHEFDGELLSARLTGGTVRVVTSSGLPDLDFVQPGGPKGERITRKQARQQNRLVVRESTIEEWLPKATDNGTTLPLLDCEDVALPDETTSLGMLNVIGFPLTDPSDRDATAVMTNSQIVYSSPDRLYLATSGWWGHVFSSGDALRRPLVRQDTTDLHAFALDGKSATYRGSGRLRGTVADRWSLDSVDGVLRVALAVPAHKDPKTDRRTKRHNAVVTMRETAAGLEETGRVDGLGVNEDIQSVRWFDDFAVVVTFRQIDPLYAIDLTTPDDPQLLGELKIPGFSAYLHPIGDDRLLGVGTDATRRGRSLGPQVSVFDVSTPASPAQLSQVTFGRHAELNASWEPRQFTWLPERETALTPLFSHAGTQLTMLALEVGDDGSLSEKRIPLRGSWQAAYDVRTLPLPDGRVVVSSSKETRFLDW